MLLNISRLNLIRNKWHPTRYHRGTGGYLQATKNNTQPGQEKLGLVVSDIHPKTVWVNTETYNWVWRFHKAYRKKKKVWAHDEFNECRGGDLVRIKPLGYRLGPMKTHVVTRIIHKTWRDELALRGSDARHLNYVPEETEHAER